jgi:hypothetical protein
MANKAGIIFVPRNVEPSQAPVRGTGLTAPTSQIGLPSARLPVNLFAELSFARARDPLAPLGPIPLVGERPRPVTGAGPGGPRGLIRERLLMGMKAEIDDTADAEGADVGELRLGRLTGRGYPIIKPPPVLDRFRVGHQSSVFGFGGVRRGTRLIGADGFPRMS